MTCTKTLMGATQKKNNRSLLGDLLTFSVKTEERLIAILLENLTIKRSHGVLLLLKCYAFQSLTRFCPWWWSHFQLLFQASIMMQSQVADLVSIPDRPAGFQLHVQLTLVVKLVAPKYA